MIEKIISGGQTGADQGGLEAGKELGIPTGGTAPAGFRTEDGRRYDLLRSFALVEGKAGATIADDYRNRTEQNIKDSDGTVIFGSAKTPGSRLTESLCYHLKKPYILIYAPGYSSNEELLKEKFLEFLSKYNVEVLNVAGNRESRNPGIQERVKCFLMSALKET